MRLASQPAKISAKMGSTTVSVVSIGQSRSFQETAWTYRLGSISSNAELCAYQYPFGIMPDIRQLRYFVTLAE
ncbi:hypothetical protein ACQ1Z4_14240, partial [Enterococcus faecalis]|uniref:hypothetical protein n=1 Tax=Enterococcus faecalis TaxID=1351 RepID=UPI003D6A23BC